MEVVERQSVRTGAIIRGYDWSPWTDMGGGD